MQYPYHTITTFVKVPWIPISISIPYNALIVYHTDLCGPTRNKIFQGEYYFMLLVNDYTVMTWVTFLE